MKRLIVFAVIVVMALLSGCSYQMERPITKMTDEYGTDWNIIKSPITEKCYEVASASRIFQGLAGMSEVPCLEYEKWTK